MIDLSGLQNCNKEAFKEVLREIFPLEFLKHQPSHSLFQKINDLCESAKHDLSAFDFEHNIIFYTNADWEADLEKAEETGHKNLAFTLIPTQTHKKADLVRATKAINTAIPSYNIIFFVGKDSRDFANPKLSIAFASRRWHKGRIVETDIITKITLIKDIDILSPSKAHKLNLESIAKITPSAVDTYYEAIESALSISKLNKEFYKEIFEHFCDFSERIELPQNDIKRVAEDIKRTFILRLFCRILFCKFLEKKGVISADIWNTNLSQNYYHEVLVPLFFATLNTPADSRAYLYEGSAPKPHHHFATLSNEIKAILWKIPYLNGGLFSPQKDDFYDPNHATAFINTLKVPNDCFENLFKTLTSYHFTIDERSKDAQEIALDPELLGQIFESLLSQLFTDNKLEKLDKTSLRKATGSYYTPREIVRYMVKSTILAYLTNATQCDESDLRTLIFTHEVSAEIASGKDEVLRALDLLKILDPACGSGAFPMEILHEMLDLYLLLDSNGAHLDSICHSERSEESHLICHSERSVSEAKNLKPYDSRSNGESKIYRYKLKVLQNSIYGVDLQPMATEIARLRCFLSLIIDEDAAHIKPLPNLEFKFVSANTLLPLTLHDGTLQGEDYVKGLAELQDLRAQYFTAQSNKKDLQEKYNATRKNLAKLAAFDNNNPLLDYDPFSTHKAANFFDSEWIFGVKEFDIVIGNPPYISSENMPQIIKDNRDAFSTAHKKTDIYVFFYEVGFNLLKQNGVISYITSNKFLSQDYGLKLRELFLANKIEQIINFNVNVFDSANVNTCIMLIKKQKCQNNAILVKNIIAKGEWNSLELDFNQISQGTFKTLENYNFRLTLNEGKIAVLNKMRQNAYKLSDICFVSYGCRPCGNAANPSLKKSDLIHATPQGNAKPYIEAKDKYITHYAVHSHDYLDYQKDKIYNAMFEELFESKKLMAGRTLGDVSQINFVYDDESRFCNDSMCCLVLWQNLQNAKHQTPQKQITKAKIEISKKYDLKFLQGVLNSSAIRFFVRELLHDGIHFYPDHQKQLPIPKISEENEALAHEIINLVDEILRLKSQGKDSHELETQIDALTYKLYDLNADEIALIENATNLKK